MNPYPWPAPAKLNLFLHVVGRRPDGYHELQSVFQFIDYCDRLDFRVTGNGIVRRASDVRGVEPEADLTVRAARALQRDSGCRHGVEIRIQKRLPMAAGLGGGSSDAATTLLALNRLWGLDLPAGRLAAIGLSLGADIPVFVHGRAAWAEGVGEHLTPVDLPEPWYVVLTPPVSVATKDVFGAPELTRNCPPLTISDFLSGQGANVCEPAVRGRFPQVAEALDALARFAPSRLSGTGGSIFAAFDREQEARDAFAELSPAWDGCVAKGLNRSPMLDVLGDMHGERP